MIRACLAFIGLLATTPAAHACEVALVLAVDVSGSVDPDEFAIQMQGLAAAIQDPTVSEALVNARAQVMLLQWTGSSRQVVSIPWTEVSDFVAVDKLAVEIANTPRRWRNYSTAIGDALALAIVAFDAPQAATCKRHVIDVSGDGPSNEGQPPEQMRAVAAARGITINALAVEANEDGLTEYFRDHVITGTGSFALRAADFRDYPARIRTKLLREVTKQIALLQ